MNKTIIAIHGRANEGKSETIKKVCSLILETFPTAIPSETPPDYTGDILLTIDINGIIIGFESQGDPNSRMIRSETLRKLAEKKCDIIICATRTKGKTIQKVDEIANDFDFHTLWISSFWSPTLNYNVLNRLAAENIVNIVKSLIIGQL